jgi:hypothetical protein
VARTSGARYGERIGESSQQPRETFGMLAEAPVVNSDI